MANDDLPLFDINDGLARLGGNRDLLKTLVQSYLSQYRDVIVQAKEQFNNNQQNEAMRALHTLKSVAGNLGFIKLYRSLIDVEGILKKEPYQADKHSQLIDDLINLNKTTIEHIEKEVI